MNYSCQKAIDDPLDTGHSLNGAFYIRSHVLGGNNLEFALDQRALRQGITLQCYQSSVTPRSLSQLHHNHMGLEPKSSTSLHLSPVSPRSLSLLHHSQMRPEPKSSTSLHLSPVSPRGLSLLHHSQMGPEPQSSTSLHHNPVVTRSPHICIYSPVDSRRLPCGIRVS